MRPAPTFVFLAFAALGIGVGLVLERRLERPDPVDALDPHAPSGHAVRAGALDRGGEDANGAVRVAGVMIQRPLAFALNAPGEFGGANEDLPFFGSLAHTRVALELFVAPGAEDVLGGRRIVQLDTDRSHLERFCDDRGTDLLVQDGFSGAFELLQRIAHDGRGLVTAVESNLAPAADATRLELVGTLALLVASATETRTSEFVALAPGAKLGVDGYAFEVVALGEGATWDDEEWSLELKTDADLASVTEWSLVDESGEAVPLTERMSWTMNGTTQKTLGAKRAFERARLRLAVWSDAQLFELPFHASSGLGLR